MNKAREKARKQVKAKKSRAAYRTKGRTEKEKQALKAVSEKRLASGIWKPEVEGDTVSGTVLSLRKEKGRFGEQDVITIETSDGVQVVYANESLRRGLEAEGVKKGSTVAVEYRGDVRTGKGRPFRTYAVSCP